MKEDIVTNRIHKGQSVMEYAIIFSVLLTAILTTGIIDRIRDTFKDYSSLATETITKTR